MFKLPVYVGGVQDKRTLSWIEESEKTRTSVFKSVGGSGLSKSKNLQNRFSGN